jgi:phenylalanyl-tRNA synthetase beta chain
MKGLLEVYVEQFWRASLQLEDAAPLPMDSARSATVLANGSRVGFVGELGAKVRNAFDLPPDLPVFLAELDLDSRLQRSSSTLEFEPLPRFPGVVRDLAFVVPHACRNRELVDSLREAGGDFLAEVQLFDVYEGEQLNRGEMSLAYTLTFRSPDRSLTNEEVDKQIDRIVKHLEKSLGARIR